MRDLLLFIVIAGGYCLGQDRATSPEAMQASIVANLRGNETTAVLSTAPMPTTPPQEGGVVSTARLRHKVPKRAKQAFEAATKLSRSGKHLESSQELARATLIDPDYADAHNHLGVQYILLGQLADAQRELLRAMELDPAFAAASVNLGRLELRLGNLAEAEQRARRAIALSPSDSQARLLLDSVLARR